jgi:hypothetical protein
VGEIALLGSFIIVQTSPSVSILVAAFGGATTFCVLLRAFDGQQRPKAARTPSTGGNEGTDILHRELARARRHELHLSIIRFKAFADAEARLASVVRESDFMWSDQLDTYLLLPEEGREGSEYAARRLQEMLASERTAGFMTIATFPEDGMTCGALLAALDGVHLGPGRAAGSGRRTAPETADLVIDLRNKAELQSETPGADQMRGAS